MGERDVARLFRHDDGQCVGYLGDAQCRAVTQSHRFGNLVVVRYRQDAGRGGNAVVGNDEGAVVQRTVLEEDVLDEPRVHVGIDGVAGVLVVVERYPLFDDDEGARLGLGHVHAGIDDRYDVGLFALLLVFEEEVEEEPPSLVGAQLHEKPFDFVLKQNDENEQTHAHELVHDGADEPHVEYLFDHDPHPHEGQHPGKDAYRARLLHHLVEGVEQQGHDEYVDNVFYAE